MRRNKKERNHDWSRVLVTEESKEELKRKEGMAALRSGAGESLV